MVLNFVESNIAGIMSAIESFLKTVSNGITAKIRIIGLIQHLFQVHCRNNRYERNKQKNKKISLKFARIPILFIMPGSE